ncbi:MAG: TraX family protein [Cyanobacteria bacterium P01_G01_bin.4]
MRLSSYSIKLIAFALMVIDHAGRIFLPGWWLPIALGRLSYPLFAWLAAEGQKNTSNIFRYIGRLLLWGSISQPVYAYFSYLDERPPQLNILFTLALGVGALAVWKRAHPVVGVLTLLLVLVLSIVLQVAGGPYSVSIIYLMSEIRYRDWKWHLAFAGTVLAFVAVYGFSVVEICALFSPFILLFYGGTRGRKTKVFYLLYPAHFIALISIRGLLMGWTH